MKRKQFNSDLSHNIDIVCDWIYERKDFDLSILLAISKSLLGRLTELTNNGNLSDYYKNDYLEAYKNLLSAIDEGDMILVADILHHDFVNELLTEEKKIGRK